MWNVISHCLYRHSVVMGGSRAYYQQCLFCDVAWLLRCSIRLMMPGLICWQNSCGKGCDSDVVVSDMREVIELNCESNKAAS